MTRLFKISMIFFGAALMLMGCSKENMPRTDTFKASFKVSAESMRTRAVIDGDGNAAGANRFIMEVYRNLESGESELYDRQVKYNASGMHETTFEVALVKTQEYDVLFWADSAATDGADLYYNTASLKEVKMNGTYVGNDDNRDAFSKAEKVLKTDDEASIAAKGDILLTRPFGQLNLITTDIEKILAATQGAKAIPDTVAIKFSAPAAFNVLTQATAGDDAEFTYEALPYYQTTGKTYSGKHTLSMDYILAPATSSQVMTVTLGSYNRGSLLNENVIANVPVQRNYRTNVIGDLLTVDGKFKVIIDEDWLTPDIDYDYDEE